MKFLIFVASQVKKNYEEIDKLTLNKSTGPIRIQAWYRITPPFCTKLKYNTKPVSIKKSTYQPVFKKCELGCIKL